MVMRGAIVRAGGPAQRVRMVGRACGRWRLLRDACRGAGQSSCGRDGADAGEYAWPPMTIERDVTLLGEGAVVTGGLPNIAQFVVGDAELTLQGLTFEDFEGRVVHATEGSSVVLREIVPVSNIMTPPILVKATTAAHVRVEDVTITDYTSSSSGGSFLIGGPDQYLCRKLGC